MKPDEKAGGAAVEGAAEDEQEEGGGIDWDALPASVVAWVRVPGTTVDYPIVQGRQESPDFYLTHDAGGERSAWGAPYIDAGCAQGAGSPLVIVYGEGFVVTFAFSTNKFQYFE